LRLRPLSWLLLLLHKLVLFQVTDAEQVRVPPFKPCKHDISGLLTGLVSHHGGLLLTKGLAVIGDPVLLLGVHLPVGLKVIVLAFDNQVLILAVLILVPVRPLVPLRGCLRRARAHRWLANILELFINVVVNEHGVILDHAWNGFPLLR